MSETILTDANGRKIGFREIDPADMLDVMEAAGDQSGNAGWISNALAMCSVTSLDGVPVPMPTSKREIKDLAKKLGNAGYSLVMQHAMGKTAGDKGETEAAASTEAEIAAAKN